MYEKYYKHCKDKPIGTYIADVPTFITAWVNQLEANSEDFDGDDYVSPDTTFLNCYPYETNSGSVVSKKRALCCLFPGIFQPRVGNIGLLHLHIP